MTSPPSRTLVSCVLAFGLALLAFTCADAQDRTQSPRADRSQATHAPNDANEPLAPPAAHVANPIQPQIPSTTTPPSTPGTLQLPPLGNSWPTFLALGAFSLIPAAVLMVSAFVRIQIVLALIRQALGSPQIPGNQVLSALALLLTLIVMAPTGKRVYDRAIEPLAAGRIDPQTAWNEAATPFKSFMIDQIARTRHERYVWEIHDLGQSLHPAPAGESTAEPTELEQFPLHVIAAAFLISELTTALFIGFAVYLPFLVIDLVVSAILSAMGLFLLPPTLVALPVKLILFALADGWMLTAGMLLRSFATG